MNTTFTISPTILLGIALMILPASLLDAQTGNNSLLQITNGPIIENAGRQFRHDRWSKVLLRAAGSGMQQT
jgi:hypothetical protein